MFDGDLICTIDHPSFLVGRTEGLPIIYDTKKAPKVVSDKDDFSKKLIKSQMDGFGTKIGFYTNVGSSMYALLSEFPEGTREREILLSRLKYFRVLQGIAIDSAKGLITDPFPQQFVKYKKITRDMDEKEREAVELNNRIIADKRPMFMRWLYPHYNKKHNDEMLSYNNISHTKWGISFPELISIENKTSDQSKLVDRYKRRSFFINNNSEMNRVSRFVEEELSKRGRKTSQFTKFDCSIYYSSDFKSPSDGDLSKMEILFKEWRSLRRNLKIEKSGHSDYSSLDEISRYIFNKACSTISSSPSALADMAVYLTYARLKKDTRSFAWSVFGEYIIDNMKSKKKERFVRVPQKNPNGTIDYLWSKYSMYLVDIEA